jgi:hypothetical protein
VPWQTRWWRAELRFQIQELPWIRKCLRSSGKRGLAVENEHVLVVRQPRSKRVVLVLEPHELGFQVANALLETAHFGDHTRVRTTDVAE